MGPAFHDHFSEVAARYANFRPHYPADLFDYLATLVSRDSLVWDCAAGSGQATVDLAARFERVIATDGAPNRSLLLQDSTTSNIVSPWRSKAGFRTSPLALLLSRKRCIGLIESAFSPKRNACWNRAGSWLYGFTRPIVCKATRLIPWFRISIRMWWALIGHLSAE